MLHLFMHLDDQLFFTESRLDARAYLGMAQQPWTAERADVYLEQLAETGFLLVPGCADVAPHADALFRQQRPVPELLEEVVYWRRHGRLHRALCADQVPHVPVRLAPEPAAPAALGWLVPAVTEGTLGAPGFTEAVALDEETRKRWLLTWAKRLSEIGHVPRLLVQLPGKDQPAHWYYATYLGDEVVPGSVRERVRLLLAGLPRYLQLPALAGRVHATPELAEQWPLLLNTSPTSWGAGQVRMRQHEELLPLGGDWY